MIIEFSNVKVSSIGLEKITKLFSNLKLKSALSECCITKEKGHPTFELLTYFLLIMLEKGSSINSGLIGLNLSKIKTPLNDLLSNERYNWRRLLFRIAKTYSKIYPADSIEDAVLIIDDTAKEKTGRKTDLLSWFRDHCGNRFFRGFQNLTIAWSNGKTIIPLDFEMKIGKENASNGKKRNYSRKSHTAQRRRFGKYKKTSILIQMIKRVNQRKFKYKYILWDTWFNCTDTLSFIFSKAVPNGKVLVSMVKNKPIYKYKNGFYNLNELSKKAGKYNRNRKTNVKSKSLIVSVLDVKSNKKVEKRNVIGKIKICFFKYPGVKRYRAILTTDCNMTEDEVLAIYLRRWSIECFFKDIKQHFGYSQSKSSKYSTMIGDLTIRYIFYIMFSFYKESTNRLLESEIKSTNQILLEFYQDLYEIWLTDFIEIMFRERIREFLEFALENGHHKINHILSELDEVLDKFFKKEVHIDKIEEYDKSA